MKHLNAIGKGVVDYDLAHDILFFKIKNRTYDRSLEINNIILDIDTKGYITGIQILEASDFFGTKHFHLKNTKKFKFQSRSERGKIEIRLTFEILVRNKIIEKNPIIMQETSERLPDTLIKATAS